MGHPTSNGTSPHSLTLYPHLPSLPFSPLSHSLSTVFTELADWEKSFFQIVPEGIEKVHKKVMNDNKGKEKQTDLASVLYGGNF